MSRAHRDELTSRQTFPRIPGRTGEAQGRSSTGSATGPGRDADTAPLPFRIEAKPDASTPAPAPLPLERRNAPRFDLDGAAVAAFRTRERSSLLAGVTVRDVSDTGLGLSSPVPVGVGTRVSLFPHESKVPTAVGTVVRCVKQGSGYLIGVERPPSPLAA